MKKCKFNVGDEVVLNQEYGGFKVGTQAVVTDTDGDLVFWKTKRGQKSSCFEHRLDLVTKASKPECKFKPGDRVVLNCNLTKCRKGAIGTVKSFGAYNATLKTRMVYVALDDKTNVGTYDKYFDFVPETPKCKFKVGDKIKANEKSNKRYCCTNLRNNFTGVVVAVNGNGTMEVKQKGRTTTWSSLDPDYFDLVGESTPEIHITVKGNKTIAVYKNGTETKTAVAKCSPEDTFDFGVGAKLALERLGVLPTDPVKEAEPPKLKLVNKYGDYGVCGTPTKLKDIRGEALFVGDVVELINDVRHKSLGYHAVVENDTKQFIMGICVDCTKDGRIDEHWRVIKNKSYSELKPGDKVRSIEYV